MKTNMTKGSQNKKELATKDQLKKNTVKNFIFLYSQNL